MNMKHMLNITKTVNQKIFHKEKEKNAHLLISLTQWCRTKLHAIMPNADYFKSI